MNHSKRIQSVVQRERRQVLANETGLLPCPYDEQKRLCKHSSGAGCDASGEQNKHCPLGTLEDVDAAEEMAGRVSTTIG